MVIRWKTIDPTTTGIVQWIVNRIKPIDFFESHIINVNTSGNDNDPLLKYGPIGVVNINGVTFWCHSSSQMRYYEVDFQSFSPFITSYSISIAKNQYPRYWELVGSNDHVNWTLLHSKTFDKEPSSDYQYFECNNPRSFRYVKLQSNYTDFRNANILTLQQYRFYGKVQWIFSTKHCKQLFNHYFLFVLIINIYSIINIIELTRLFL